VDPGIQRGLGVFDRRERTDLVEQFPAQRAVESLDRPGRRRKATLGQPRRDPILTAGPFEQHLDRQRARELSGELLAVVSEHLHRNAPPAYRHYERIHDRRP